MATGLVVNDCAPWAQDCARVTVDVAPVRNSPLKIASIVALRRNESDGEAYNCSRTNHQAQAPCVSHQRYPRRTASTPAGHVRILVHREIEHQTRDEVAGERGREQNRESQVRVAREQKTKNTK